ncbi:hypothetical protein FCM35_KLT08434 [Carex littledalei]|uniref:Uncharacterized protein n=1 Tax=Carex littledalei TaxID=544730 RepID=A0A833VKE5_9POAL|nr:hypothetical protein FCM35_KLT08434 [Carex littledalei]
MELSFSIREYTNSMRSSDMDKCWPFDPEEKNRSLPSMNVRKFRWWAQGLDRKVKQRSPKKRSITELFAMAPPISTVEARSEGPDEGQEQKLITPDQLARETLPDDVEKKKPSKGKKRKIRSEIIKAFESKSDDLEREEEVKLETIKERKKKKKKKLEIQIYCEPKDNAGEPELSKMETSSESTKRDIEVKTLSNTLITGTDEEKLREEPDEALIPLISILKKCKRNKNHAKNGKGVTFSGIDSILGPDEDTMACSVDPLVTFSNNEDKDTSSKCIIDLNEALPEPIDLNSCLEDQFMEAFNCIGVITGTLGSPKTDICHSSHGISSPPLNSPQKMCRPTSDFSKNLEPVMNMNSDISTISVSANASTEQPPMIPRTVRLMGKDVTVTSTDLKSVSTCNKAQETASSSHASSSYYSDGANNNNSNSTDNNNCSEMNFSTVQFAPGSYMPENYSTTNTTGSVISFPVVPGINFYHPQFPVVSPPMISFPLGGSAFPQPYGLNISGFGDESYNREKSCR